jgi:hypothetical protein
MTKLLKKEEFSINSSLFEAGGIASCEFGGEWWLKMAR